MGLLFDFADHDSDSVKNVYRFRIQQAKTFECFSTVANYCQNFKTCETSINWRSRSLCYFFEIRNSENVSVSQIKQDFSNSFQDWLNALNEFQIVSEVKDSVATNTKSLIKLLQAVVVRSN